LLPYLIYSPWGLIPKSPLARGRLCGGEVHFRKGFEKSEENTQKKQLAKMWI
jgi:aryl-alcohol dehydrogenase-like predicted oxidoreductase